MNETLPVSKDLYSGKYLLRYQVDGNLVLYSDTGFPAWASNTSGSSGGRVLLKADGDLVVYNSAGGVAWASSSQAGWRAAPGPGCYLVVTKDGKLVIYAKDDTVLWTAIGQPVPKSWPKTPID